MARCPTCHRRLNPGQSCAQHAGAAAPAREGGESVGPQPQWRSPVGALVGSGGFAAVWEIPGTGVLKVAHASHDLARARMRREAEALELVGAQSVPRLLDHGVLADGRAWIAMEHVSGHTLADRVVNGPLDRNAVVVIGAGTAEALARMHEAGFVHRDIKPDNVVQRCDGSIVLLDLGLARKIPDDPDDPTRAGVQVGSLEYMPPEQLVAASNVDERADLYALGCVLFELCAGRPPFVGDAAALERAHAALRPPALGALAPVPADLEALVHECLAKQPERRPASAREIARRLRAVGGEPTAQRGRSVSVIREGTQPVVLLWAELPRVDRALLGLLGARKIAIASQRGRKVLGTVVGAEHPDPAGAALAAARELAAAGARVALHLDALTVMPRAGALAASGAAIDRPEGWLPPNAWSGVVLTAAIAPITQTPTRPAPEVGPGFVALAEVGELAELFGREAVLADVAADAAAAFAGDGPGFALLVGDHGEGKTAMLHAVASRIAELGARVLAIAIPPPGSGRSGHARLAELVGATRGPVVRSIGDALRGAARAQPTALLVDDLHLAEHEVYDALEYATLGGERLPLWVLGTATPRIDQRRPKLGQRAARHRRERLQPLEEDAAVAMTAALLRPAEYPPLRALRQIAAIARGNPLHLATLAREIHARGAIRTRDNGEYFLDTTKLDTLPPIALGPWLAARELSSISLELAALARICAVLGDEVERAELAAVVETVERAGGATTPLDVDVGLGELVDAGILVDGEQHQRWAFRQALLQEGVYATTNEDERRMIHAAAFEYWRARDASSPVIAEHVARHAEAAGERRVAAAAFATLGTAAQRAHRTLDADQAWQGALRNLDARDADRACALLGRARARYKLQRIKDALADLEEALAIATEIEHAALEIEILLEQATALDWSDDHAGSAAAAERAQRRLAVERVPELAVDVELAIGRTAWRARAFDEAATRLRATKQQAHALGRHDVEILASLLLATLLVDTGNADAALAEFDELIPLCEREDDRLHLGSTYANRSWLWSARGQLDRCAEDLRRVIQIGREIGQAALERAATYNLAEARLWADDLDEALRLATRSLAIQRSYGESVADHWDLLLIARIQAARDDVDALGITLASLDTSALEDPERATVAVLECVRDRAPIADARWTDALARTASLPVDTRLELAALAATRRALPPALAEEVRALAQTHPLWASRSEMFAAMPRS